ncbi:MAG: hypothetical protein KU29_11715 [Sulfurovum sp. FS06-10]|jgi:hypothetical protein|nr:MAG: hypothetical protein KU29_11715 [Sulfurovum sp. FS06-10]
MKPILAQELDIFLKRFDNFNGGEFRSIEILSPTNIIVTLSGQDGARAFDWVTIKLELNGVSDAKLLEGSKLFMLDMSDGISIINDNKHFAFGIGKCTTLSSLKNSICYIICSSLKYQEGSF